MKQSMLEPGLLQALRLYIVLAAFLLFLSWRIFSPIFGVGASPQQFLTPGKAVLLFLVIYVSLPWWQRRMGRAFLPVALILLAAQAVLENYLALHWMVPAQSRDLAALAFLLRIWVTFQFLVLFVAWQYDLVWVMVVGIGLSLLDAAIVFPFFSVRGELYPVFSMLVAGRLLAVTGTGLGFAWLMKRQRAHRAALAEANQKLLEYAVATEQLAVSQERNRLARELHDTLAHSLSGVSVQLEAVQALWEVSTGEARRILEQALQSTRSGLTEVRRALQALRASPLEDLGLALAVSDLAKSTAVRARLILDLDVQYHLESPSPEVGQCIYRVAQEALTNVARHAEARSLQVVLGRKHREFVLTVVDDGRGFDPGAVNGTHFGLRGLRERAEMVGGLLQVDSQTGRGTTIRLVVPGQERRAGDDSSFGLR